MAAESSEGRSCLAAVRIAMSEQLRSFAVRSKMNWALPDSFPESFLALVACQRCRMWPVG